MKRIFVLFFLILILIGCTEDKVNKINVEDKEDSFDLEKDLEDTEGFGSLDDLEILVDENTFK